MAARKLSMSARRPSSGTRQDRFSSPPVPKSARSEYGSASCFTPSGPLPAKKLSFGGAVLPRPHRVDSVTPATAPEPVKVHLRIRPFTAAEEDAKTQEPTIVQRSNTTVELRRPEASRSTSDSGGVFTFSKVHGPSEDNTRMYEDVMKPLVSTAVKDGRNALLFAYGMTNAGKTHTVIGSDTDPGLLPRAVGDVLTAVQEANSRNSAPPAEAAPDDGGSLAFPDLPVMPLPPLSRGEHLTVTVSCLEIYNEQVLDALVVPSDADTQRPVLKLKNGFGGRVYAQGLKQVAVSTVEECLDVVNSAARNRQVAETVLNSDSSRSHSVFCLHIWKHSASAAPGGKPATRTSRGRALTDPNVTRLWSKLSVVDLAGSERQRRTANRGARLREAGAINNSLMSLMHCMETMRWNQRHPTAPPRLVPFRETKLTRLFQDNLAGTGTGLTTMVLNVGPAPADFDETIHAVKYGAVAKEVVVAPPKVDSRWAVHRGSRRAPSRRRGVTAGSMALIAEEGGDGVTSTPRDGGRGPAAWEAQRKELISQVEDLQSLNASLRAELRLANDRAATVEMEVRQEVADEMAAQLVEMENRYRVMQTKETLAAESRVNKLVALYNRRTPNPRRTAPLVVPSTTGKDATAPLSPSAARDDPEVDDAVVECEQEIDRIQARHRQDMEALQAELRETRRVHELRTQALEAANKELTEKLEALTMRDTDPTAPTAGAGAPFEDAVEGKEAFSPVMQPRRRRLSQCGPSDLTSPELVPCAASRRAKVPVEPLEPPALPPSPTDTTEGAVGGEDPVEVDVDGTTAGSEEPKATAALPPDAPADKPRRRGGKARRRGGRRARAKENSDSNAVVVTKAAAPRRSRRLLQDSNAAAPVTRALSTRRTRNSSRAVA